MYWTFVFVINNEKNRSIFQQKVRLDGCFIKRAFDAITIKIISKILLYCKYYDKDLIRFKNTKNKDSMMVFF